MSTHAYPPNGPGPILAEPREVSAETRALVRKAISDAYYDARNDGQTMEQAADRAVDALVPILQSIDENAYRRGRAAVAAVEALYGSEPPPAWIKGTSIVRVTRYDRRLGCDITESMLRVDDVRAALAAGREDR